MLKSPQNRMITGSPHIREVGPHQHKWAPVGTDGSGEHYRECSVCGTRTVESGNFRGALRQLWLNGGDWDLPNEAPRTENGQDPNGEAMKFPRRKGRPTGQDGAESEPVAQAML